MKDLLKVVDKHFQNNYQKPIAQHTLMAFKDFEDFFCKFKNCNSLILDNGCGAGESGIYLARKYPNSIVISIDRSQVRLSKTQNKFSDRPSNLKFIRADLLDFWRLLLEKEYKVDKQFFFYPNPYPKKSQLKNRFYAHPILPTLVKLGGDWEVRSNCLFYIEDMACVLSHLNGKKVEVEKINHLVSEENYVSLFELKYWQRGENLYRCVSSL